jgi:hypothetical protein
MLLGGCKRPLLTASPLQNPSITSDCGNYVTGKAYCVEAPVDSGTSPTTAPITTNGPGPTTTTSAGNGVTTPTPTQDGMVDGCNKFHFVEAKQNCDTIAKTYGITRAQFISYNPSVGDTCAGMWAEVYVCVGLVGGSPVTTTAAPTKTGNGIATPTPTQDGMIDGCNKFHFVEAKQNCDTIAKTYGITRAQFVSYNPSVGDTCAGMWAEVYVCVGLVGGSPVTTTAAPTKTGNGIATPTPTQDGMVDNCDAFHFVEPKQNCDTIAKTYGITRAQFVSYNPSVGDTCAGMWAEVYVCVSVVGSEPSSTKTQSPTTTGNGNGVSTPSPTQPEMITDCNKFYFVKSKDTCASIAKANNLSQTQFFNWQPSVGTDCAGLWLDAYVCVGRIGVTPTPTAVPTSTKPGNGVATPTPIQDGMVSTTTCQSILDQYRITLAQFTKWNPGAGSGCNTLWGNTYACVGVIS